MKKVWAIELDLLNQLLEVCKKHNIKIFASGGTMLGAVRHAGMIPWDDDIDMVMLREDYIKLCEVAPMEFKAPYFFQTEYTDPGSLRGHAQLRNSSTTGILLSEKNKFDFNQGIFIDIFPLDNVIDDNVLFQKQFKDAMYHKKKAFRYAGVSTRYYDDGQKNLKHYIKKILHFFGKSVFACLEQKEYTKYEQICMRYNNLNTKRVSTLSFRFGNERHFKLRDDYEELVEMPFEFLKIPVGKNYDHALKQRFGNYKKFVKDGSYHGGVFFDVEQEYKIYCKKC